MQIKKITEYTPCEIERTIEDERQTQEEEEATRRVSLFDYQMQRAGETLEKATCDYIDAVAYRNHLRRKRRGDK